MFIYLNKKRGQSTLEYAIIIAVVVGALLAIQVYVKRGVQGRFKQAADDIGEQFSAKGTYTTNVTSYTTSNDTTKAYKLDNDDMSQTTSNVSQSQNTNTYLDVGSYNAEGWGQ